MQPLNVHQKPNWMLIAAGLLGAVGVAIGAYSAHGLEGWLLQNEIDLETIEKRLQQCDIAVRYHLLHSVALLAVGLSTIGLSTVGQRSLARLVAVFWLAGTMLFCGGLYSMVFFGVVGHWAIVPSGGLCFILGWVAVLLWGTRFSTPVIQ